MDTTLEALLASHAEHRAALDETERALLDHCRPILEALLKANRFEEAKEYLRALPEGVARYELWWMARSYDPLV